MSFFRKKSVFLVTFILWISAVLWSAKIYPNFTEAKVAVEGQDPTSISWPFTCKPNELKEIYTLTTHLDYSSGAPSRFIIEAEDVILSMKVNAIAVPLPAWPSLHKFKMDLKPWLTKGPNEMTIFIQSMKESSVFRIGPDPLDEKFSLWAIMLILSSAGLWACAMLRLFPALSSTAVWITTGGVSLRIVYFLITPYYVRAHDLGGHTQYIKYVAEYLTLPPTTSGWETHQAPLYYLLMGCWMHLTGQASSSWIYGQWQLFALIMAVASIFLAIKIGQQLFKNDHEIALYLILVSFFPGFVYYSGRIGNDVLFGFMSFIWFYLLLKWWETPGWRQWIFLSLSLGLTFLTKNGAIVLAGITVVTLGLCVKIPMRDKIKNGLVLSAVVLFLAGWYQIPKALHASSPSTFVVGNIEQLSEDMRIPAKPLDFVTFNPWIIITKPFNNAYTPHSRVQYYPEYLFKSALFGEWTWPEWLKFSAQGLAITSLMIVGLSIAGIAVVQKPLSGFLTPILATIALILIAQIIYVFKHPFNCNQDFRFFILLAIPIGCLATAGAAKIRTAGTVIIGAFAVTSLTFFASVIFT